MNVVDKHLCAVVLAGGRSSRMGGRNKALVKYKGRCLYEYAVDNVKAHAKSVVINTNRDKQYFHDVGLKTIDDGDYIDHGPLAGIAAAFAVFDCDALIIASCDQLALPKQIYADLIGSATLNTGAVLQDKTNMVPTCAVLPKKLRSNVLRCLANKQLRLIPFMREHCVVLEYPEFEFSNINRLAQLA